MKRIIFLTLMLGMFVTGMTACTASNDETTIDLLENEEGLVLTASGLQYIITEEGSGEQAAAGDKVLVHYTGTLTDGTVFDSSRGRNEPLPFTLGAGQVIAGWDEGVALLREGGKAKLVIPADLAYGDRGFSNLIPAGATLIFEVELVEIVE